MASFLYVLKIFLQVMDTGQKRIEQQSQNIRYLIHCVTYLKSSHDSGKIEFKIHKFHLLISLLKRALKGDVPAGLADSFQLILH